MTEFLYARQQELMQSPYYAHTQNMTHDLDRFYKDLMQNDFLTNFKKYTVMLYDIVKTKYYPLIPFGEYIPSDFIQLLAVFGNLFC